MLNSILISLTLLLAPPVSITPQTPAFADAAADYQRIWNADGPRITAGLERVSGLRFPADPIPVIVFEGMSSSGEAGGPPMRLRASYDFETKQATLAHELGHRLIANLPRDLSIDEHRTLFLILYDVWTDLWGSDFADRMVALERKRRGYYDYDRAWTWALAMTREERQARFAALRARR